MLTGKLHFTSGSVSKIQHPRNAAVGRTHANLETLPVRYETCSVALTFFIFHSKTARAPDFAASDMTLSLSFYKSQKRREVKNH